MAATAENLVELPAEIKRGLFLRQAMFLIAIAASVALGVYVTLWSQTPNYGLLYGSLPAEDIGQVLDALQKSGIEYRVDENSGAVMVPSASVHEARIKLAAEGLPKSANAGYGVLQQEQGLGTSQFIEKARYQHALETELARSVSQISSVRTARVHLAMPKQSVFVRERKPVSASVLVDLYAGHRLSAEQVAAISNLVAASVPNLDVNNVSIVDQNGRLLTQGGSARELALTASQFQYARSVEESYMKRIEDILIPILGQDGIKAQVTADFDFTHVEQTRESYNPDLPAVRSEKMEEEMSSAAASMQGIPGALSNQPPAAGTAPEVADGTGAETETASNQGNMQRRTVRNYELDRTISHTRMPVGKLNRLSVAVVIDHKKQTTADGSFERVEHSPEEINRFSNLVKEAIGFNATRGDTVNIINAPFAVPEVPEPLPATPIWQEPWVWDIAKQAVGALFVLFLVFGVLKPAMKNMVNKEITVTQAALANNAEQAAALNQLEAPAEEGVAAQGAMANQGAPQLSNGSEFDQNVDAVKQVIMENPKVAATVVKNWVGEES